MPRLRRAPLAALLLTLMLQVVPARASGPFPFPGLRVTGGATWREADDEWVGILDVLPEIELFDFGDALGLGLQIGYGFEGGDTHLLQIGADVTFYGSDGLLSGTLGLRGVIGSVQDELGGGVRVVAGLGFLLDIFHVEVGYQLLDRHDGAAHDVRISAGVDLARIVLAPFYAMAFH